MIEEPKNLNQPEKDGDRRQPPSGHLESRRRAFETFVRFTQLDGAPMLKMGVKKIESNFAAFCGPARSSPKQRKGPEEGPGDSRRIQWNLAPYSEMTFAGRFSFLYRTWPDVCALYPNGARS
jgi:hypothetical protein